MHRGSTASQGRRPGRHGFTHVYSNISCSTCTLYLPHLHSLFSGSYIPRIKYATQKPLGPQRNKEESYRGNLEQQQHTTSRWWTAHSRRPVHRCYFLSKHKERKKKSENANVFKYYKNYVTKCLFFPRSLWLLYLKFLVLLWTFVLRQEKRSLFFLLLTSVRFLPK